MKKILYVCLLVFILCGCQKNIGSFKEGTLNMERYYEVLEKQIEKKHWRMGLLNDESWSKAKIEKEYNLDMTKIEESYVKSSLVEAQFVEIAIFKLDKSYDSLIKEAITYRLNALSSSYGKYMEDAAHKLSDYGQGRIGKYYYFILGEDYKKVVNYIRNSN